MSMFSNYDDLQDNYTPNNIQPVPQPPCLSNLDPFSINKPFEERNEKGELIGYWWNYGDTVNLEFHVEGNVIIEDDAILYTAYNDGPSISTVGKIGQKAYNVVELKSWTCTLIRNTSIKEYVWTLDTQFENPAVGDRNIYIGVGDYIKDKQVTVKLYNFRMEEVAMQTFAGNPDITFSIDKELSSKLVKGNYYCTFTVWDVSGRVNTILSQDTLSLTVK